MIEHRTTSIGLKGSPETGFLDASRSNDSPQCQPSVKLFHLQCHQFDIRRRMELKAAVVRTAIELGMRVLSLLLLCIEQLGKDTELVSKEVRDASRLEFKDAQ